MFLDDGNAAGIGADQLGSLGEYFVEEGLQFFVAFLEKVGYFREHLDFQVFVSDFPDNPFHHFRMGLQYSCFKVAEPAVLACVVVHQADDLTAYWLIARYHVERLEGHFFGQGLFLEEMLGKVRNEKWPQELFVGNEAVVPNEFGHQRTAPSQADGAEVIIECLEPVVGRIAGKDLQPRFAVPADGGDEYRCQGDAVDKSNR